MGNEITVHVCGFVITNVASPGSWRRPAGNAAATGHTTTTAARTD